MAKALAARCGVASATASTFSLVHLVPSYEPAFNATQQTGWGAFSTVRRSVPLRDDMEEVADIISFSLSPQVLSDEGYEAVRAIMARPIAKSTTEALPLPLID